MIDLNQLCADLKDPRSDIGRQAARIVPRACACLGRPSPETARIMAGWREDFRFIYGDVEASLSGNSKLDRAALLQSYGVAAQPDEGEAGAVQRLFFAIQTYFSLLVKAILLETLRGLRDAGGFSREAILRGDFAEAYGIAHYCRGDWTRWPVYELENGFAELVDAVLEGVAAYRIDVPAAQFQSLNQYDNIKQIYEAIIPKALRHALGEYYTPDWLAEATLDRALKAHGGDLRGLTLIDPTCGSGTFLFKAVAAKRRAGCGLREILDAVRGIDINPLAVLTAKTNYLLSVLDLLDGETPIALPVYVADAVKPGEPAGAAPGETSGDPVAALRGELRRDRAAAAALEKSDLVVGNPPWVNWEYLPEPCRRGSQHLWRAYGLFAAKGRELSFAKEDISVLITCVAMDRLLKDGGVIGFVLRQGMFKSAQNGVGFRRFRLGDAAVRVLRVDDLSPIRAFENATNSAALFYARKGEPTAYPVPYFLWEKREEAGRRAFGAYAPLSEVMRQVNIRELRAAPAVPGDPASPWLTAPADRLEAYGKVLGTNPYRARTGVFTGGANAVYWLNLRAGTGGTVVASNVVDRAKRKAEPTTAELETTFLFPMLKGSGLRRWRADYDTYLLCPHTAETRMWPVPREELARIAPRTLRYLERFRPDLNARKGFAGWERDIQRQQFHAILRVGEYTFSRYKVAWKYIASAFVCAVVGAVDDPLLGEKPLLPNEKVMYVALDDETEAYYLCGLLSSSIVAGCVQGYMNPTSISAHVLDKLNLPPYDPADPRHREIAALCKAGHGAADPAACLARIDALAEEMYGG